MRTTYVVLLRGINVGGDTRLLMADLRALLEGLGHQNIATYIQSGNVVLNSDLANDALSRGIEEALHERANLDVPVIVRNRDELAAVAEQHPFAAVESDEAKLHVMFLADAPAADAIANLDAAQFAPDTFTIEGREMFIHYPNGAGRSKLNINRVERALGTTATGRNWRTVAKLLEMANDAHRT
ncbi:MAG TPA: DUF1697 domain-containing protein [Dehalococcoidia bacterium]|nr:DUF1697 domain-containing protein [Dehalococcoidia bacterium]